VSAQPISWSQPADDFNAGQEPFTGWSDEDVALRLADVLCTVEELEAEASRLRASLAQRLGEGTHTLGKVKATVYPQRRFDPALAVRTLDPSLIPAIMKPTIDSTLARRVLTPEQYAACQSVGRMTVRLK